jgi:cyclopropane fatty-acyl-phospholipid synthase-like methyltransferase
MKKTVEPQYQFHVDLKERFGLTSLGIEKSGAWREDPRRLLFCLARYKFVAKMLSGSNRVLEVGCGDGWPIPIVLQEVKSVHGVDIDPIFIDDMLEHLDPKIPCTCAVHDMLMSPLLPQYDAAYSLDVLEHITPGVNEKKFLRNLADSIKDDGVAIIGIPSLQSQIYASPASKAGHVNCKDAKALKQLLKKYFMNVFIFSMNDEVVHTGFHQMSQYIFALCVTPRRITRI